jgi:hypothetical protein
MIPTCHRRERVAVLLAMTVFFYKEEPMEERFVTGYCRRIDQSRMVAAELENGKLTEADCDFGSCPYEADCPIARELSRMTST